MLLLSGFEPFDGATLNPSAEVVAAIRSDPPPGIDLKTVVLPVETDVAADRLLTLRSECDARAVIMLGEARGQPTIRLEHVAINLRDFAIEDNAGSRLVDQPVVTDGPDAHFATLPLRNLLETLRAVGVPVERSLSAGSYLCNELSYRVLHESDRIARAGGPRITAGFVHLPSLPDQATGPGKERPTMPIEDQIIAIRAIIERVAAGPSGDPIPS